MGQIKKSKKNYTQVSNTILNDNKLSLKARGLFAFMDSKIDGWNFTIKSISKQVKDGEDSVRTALEELKNNGYIKYHKQQNGHGIYELFDVPNVENPNVENPKMGKSQRINNTKPITKLINNNTRHTDINFKLLITKLNEKALFRNKIKNTDEEYQEYLELEDTSNLLEDYLEHQIQDKKYSLNFLNFLKGYSNFEKEEVRLWA